MTSLTAFYCFQDSHAHFQGTGDDDLNSGDCGILKFRGEPGILGDVDTWKLFSCRDLLIFLPSVSELMMWGSNEVLLHYSNLIYPGAMNAFHMIFISRLVSHRMWNTFKYKKRLSIRRKLHFKKQQNHQFLDKWRGFNFCCHSSADKLATVWAQIAFVAINWIKLKYSEVVLSWHHIDMFVYESLTNNIKRPNRIPLPNKPKTRNLFYR